MTTRGTPRTLPEPPRALNDNGDRDAPANPELRPSSTTTTIGGEVEPEGISPKAAAPTHVSHQWRWRGTYDDDGYCNSGPLRRRAY